MLVVSLVKGAPERPRDNGAVRRPGSPAITWNDVLRFLAPLGARRFRFNVPTRWATLPALLSAANAGAGQRVWCRMGGHDPVVPFFLLFRRGARVVASCESLPSPAEAFGYSKLARRLGATPDHAARFELGDDPEGPANAGERVDRFVSADFVEWLPDDRVRPFAEAMGRSLRPGGRAVIALPIDGGDERTPRLYDPAVIDASIVRPSGLSIRSAQVVALRRSPRLDAIQCLPEPFRAAGLFLAGRFAERFVARSPSIGAAEFADAEFDVLLPPSGVSHRLLILALEKTIA